MVVIVTSILETETLWRQTWLLMEALRLLRYLEVVKLCTQYGEDAKNCHPHKKKRLDSYDIIPALLSLT